MKTDALPPRDEATGKFTGAFAADDRSDAQKVSDDSAQLDEQQDRDRKSAAAAPKEEEAPAADKGKSKNNNLAGVNQLVERFLGGPIDEEKPAPKGKVKGKKADEAPADAPEPKPGDETVDEEAEETPKKKAAAPAPKVQPKPQPTEDDDTRTSRIAAKVVQEMHKAAPPIKEEKKAAPAEPEVPTAESERIATLERMEKLFPERYKGISAKYKTSYAKLVEYSQKWEKENPGQQFDENAEDHAAFFELNDVDWDDNDYLKAMADAIAETKVASATQETNAKLSRIEKKDALRDAEPTIYREQGRAAAAYWKKLGKDFEGLIKPDGELDLKKAEALSKKDPDAFADSIELAKTLDTEVHELYGIMNGLIDYSEKNPVHAALAEFASEREAALMAKPIEERKDQQGRDFATAEDYYKVPKEKREKTLWTFSAQDLAALRAGAKARIQREKVAAEEARLAKFAKSRGWREPEKGEKPDEQAADETVEETAETAAEEAPDDEKPNTPGGGSASKMAAGKSGGKAGSGNALDAFGERFLGAS